ncbi:SH3 domain-containing protein [Paenibacillus thiaminolyticus]|uniref:Ligand-binding protein SH3 n=1 Tax=Paenibacillus thiaminolyticus TaxID=49283 RepID=A0AAP9DV88_PANTH|nr:SH3 domain-containing protein [Paenibacillus thiaminolyticus]MCY9536835.1 SH3 domain-containing protein [Paenibacillus thiaminolyticus]MCY9605245.1 SH3 domain-containing protein [Paenibacillus thiaminolyticus]MCY9610086.1 SH3 domain-containing protein [Paenibacillus thiaminolyticus]MCY9615304.1 SH3 domain-containing protein [Paenibacillus thiaminolyticus]MCY9622281.1 SH3 domain-containing protein [Paenibacillus thiaminolyticus]
MSRPYRVIKAHRSNYPQPIRLSAGQRVILGRLDDGPEGWRNWRYCYTLDRKLEGWVPEQIIEKRDQEGIILEAYCAHELNVDPGDIVNVHRELNKWVWCRREGEEEWGWVPLDHVEPIE